MTPHIFRHLILHAFMRKAYHPFLFLTLMGLLRICRFHLISDDAGDSQDFANFVNRLSRIININRLFIDLLHQPTIPSVGLNHVMKGMVILSGLLGAIKQWIMYIGLQEG